MKKEARKKQILKRKNFFPTLVITIIFWVLTATLVYFIDPDTFFAVPGFFILVFLALLFTFSTIFSNSRRGLLTALALISFLFLRYFGIGNVLNFLLICGLFLSIEYSFIRN